MNTTPLPSSIHDAARRRAVELRNEAITQAIGWAIGLVRRALRQPRRETAPCHS